MKLRAEPYTLELRHDIFKKEQVLNELKDLRNMIEQVNK